MKKIIVLMITALLSEVAAPAFAAEDKAMSDGDTLMFDFGEFAEDGWVQVTDGTKYKKDTGYRFSMVSYVENTGAPGGGALSDAVKIDHLNADKVSFDVDVPPGVYEVSVYSGDIQYMTAALEGEPAILDMQGSCTEGRAEIAVTDGQLNISFMQSISGTELAVSAVCVTRKSGPEERKKRVFVCGDSLAATYYPLFVTDPSDESMRGGWGQLLENFLPDDLYVHNLSSPGQTAKGFVEKGLLDGVLKFSEPGDHVIVSFGYNDHLTCTSEEYSAYMTEILDAVTEKGCSVIVCSEPAETDEFSDNGTYTAANNRYEAEAKAAAEAAGAAYIDLHAAYAKYLCDIGKNAAESLFHIMWNNTRDELHTNRKGAGQAARILVEECVKNGIADFEGKVWADGGISQSSALKCRIDGNKVYILNTSPSETDMSIVTNTYNESGALSGTKTVYAKLPAYDVFSPNDETELAIPVQDESSRSFIIDGGIDIRLVP